MPKTDSSNLIKITPKTDTSNLINKERTNSNRFGYSITGASLGTKMIEGVECTGNSSKTIIAPGTFGNERELVTTSESWYSNELKIGILNKRNDLQTGNYTYQLTNIKREEPDKSLFSVPADYKIIN